jgi:cytochrome c556
MCQKWFMIVAFAFALTGAVATAAVQALTPKQAVEIRKNRFRELGAAFKSINDQAKSGKLVKVMLRTSARMITGTARDQYKWFPVGSGPESGLKTKAKSKIWSNAPAFQQAQANFQRQADLMAQAVEVGLLPQIQAQAKALGQACAACHKIYREAD